MKSKQISLIGVVAFHLLVVFGRTKLQAARDLGLSVAQCCPKQLADFADITSDDAVQTSVQSLLPGSYGGTVTFTANGAVNGSHLVAVNLVVSAGPPAVFSIFPTSIIQALTVNPMISINGGNFL